MLSERCWETPVHIKARQHQERPRTKHNIDEILRYFGVSRPLFFSSFFSFSFIIIILPSFFPFSSYCVSLKPLEFLLAAFLSCTEYLGVILVYTSKCSFYLALKRPTRSPTTKSRVLFDVECRHKCSAWCVVCSLRNEALRQASVGSKLWAGHARPHSPVSPSQQLLHLFMQEPSLAWLFMVCFGTWD